MRASAAATPQLELAVWASGSARRSVVAGDLGIYRPAVVLHVAGVFSQPIPSRSGLPPSQGTGRLSLSNGTRSREHQGKQ
jgi:hypothetical protein